MNCPICNVRLAIMERQGIEIDYCPKCRGVWLDRGELDKLIERSASASQQYGSPAGQGYERERHDQHDKYGKHDKDDYKHGDDYQHRHKKKSFLDDIFDFD